MLPECRRQTSALANCCADTPGKCFRVSRILSMALQQRAPSGDDSPRFRSARGFEEGSLLRKWARRTAERVWRGMSHLPFEPQECLELKKESAQDV